MKTKTLLTTLAVTYACFALSSVALADDFKTVNGTEYKNATVSRVEPDGIVLKSKSGIVKVYFTELPKEVQERFHYDAQKATKYSADEERQIATTNAQAAALGTVEDAHRKALQARNRTAVALSGQVLSVTDDGVLLAAVGVGFPGVASTVAFVKNVGRGHIDGDYVNVLAVPAGTYQYTSAIGAARTVPAFDAGRP